MGKLGRAVGGALDRLRRGPLGALLGRSWFYNFVREDLSRRVLVDLFDRPPEESISHLLRPLRWDGPRILTSTPVGPPRLRVLLVQPPLPSNRRHKRVLPMGLAYLAATIRERLPAVQVGILDAQVHDLDLDGMVAAAGASRWDIVGVGAWTVQFPLAARFLAAIKRTDPAVLTILGGVHATVAPREAAAAADVIVVGEGEETLVELLRAHGAGAPLDVVEGVARLVAGSLVGPRPRSFIDDLDRLPFPAYDLLPLPLYDNQLHVVGGERLPIFGSRGCPFACAYCNSPQIWRRKVRYRRAARVIDEMAWAGTRYGITRFHFWDDNFTLDRDFVTELCAGIQARGLKVQWVALDRAELVVRNADLLGAMRAAGCVGIEIGVESVNADTFAFIEKGQGLDDVRRAVAAQKRAGLAPLYTCMAFNPGETINGYYFQKRFLDQIQEQLEWYSFFHPFPFPLYLGQFATPYPGTDLDARAAELGVVLREFPEDRYHSQINFVPRTLLDDVPLRTAPIGEPEYLTLLMALTAGFWSWFPATMRRREVGALLAALHPVLTALLRAFDGQHTLDAIIEETRRAQNRSVIEVARLAALSVYVLGQLGLVRSAVHEPDAPIVPQPVPVPPARLRQMKRLLAAGGVRGIATLAPPPRLAAGGVHRIATRPPPAGSAAPGAHAKSGRV